MINKAVIEKVVESTKKLEGYRRFAYDDSTGAPVELPKGKLTIGYGLMIEAGGYGVSERVAEVAMREFLEDAVIPEILARFPWVTEAPDQVQIALLEMGYQLGVPRLAECKKMLAALEAENYREAIKEAWDSVWAKQTPVRARHIESLYSELV